MSLKSIREFIKTVPENPGVYIIKGEDGKAIYIGKARSLRTRLITHFRPSSAKDFKEGLIQKNAKRVDFIETSSEAEALLLESSLIKEHWPLYNKELKDDKSYPFLKITMADDYPRLMIVRGRKSDGSKYFGPYTNVRLLHQALSLLRRLFPMRTCNPVPKRTCLMYHIGQCHAPCIKEIDKDHYHQIVKELIMFLEGKKDTLVRVLAKRMREASQKRKYETARLYRDQMRALSVVAISKTPIHRANVLQEMEDIFSLSKYPKRVEAFDISNFAGKNSVGSMVVFENGKAKRSDYRKFKIKDVHQIDDYQMMKEVVRRRYERLLNEKKALPDLVLIDGGKGHLASAKFVLDDLNLSDLDTLSIAKQHEYIFKPGRSRPYVLPQNSMVLQLLRQIRDEAHRFAISYYRSLHKKELKWSELDQIPGIGPTRKKRIMRCLKDVVQLHSMTKDDLESIPGINPAIAKAIEEYFKKG